MSSLHKSSSKFSIAGAVALGLVVSIAGAPAKSAEKTLYDFRGGSDGEGPLGSLIADGSGKLYGTTFSGGGGTGCNNGSTGCGTVFVLSANRHETVLHAFTGASDGALPNPGLAADNAGNLYGTTQWGGGTSCYSGIGCGTVFKLAPDGMESVFYAFQGGSDGYQPNSGLIADNNGNLYGETLYGGNGSFCGADGCGTVFEVQPDGTKLTLYSFQGGSDGASPGFGVIRDSAGNLYGTTGGGGGGSGCGGGGCGTVFKIAANGTESVLYAFQGGADGKYPVGVTIDSSGNLYGATQTGGSCSFQLYVNDCGTVYKLAPDGTKTVLYNFQAGNDGLMPWAPLIMDTNGNLYGTTYAGGGDGCRGALAPKMVPYGCGTVFKLTPDGKETVLFSARIHKGAHPSFGSLFLNSNSKLDGAAPYGGKYNKGTVFEVTP